MTDQMDPELVFHPLFADLVIVNLSLPCYAIHGRIFCMW